MTNTCLSKHLWGEIEMGVSLILNLSSSSTLDVNTPHVLWFENSPGSHSKNTDFLQGLERVTYPILKAKELSKLSSKSKQCVLLGYKTGVRAYRLWDQETKKIIVSCNVTFNERSFPYLLPETSTASSLDIDNRFTFPNHNVCKNAIPKKHSTSTSDHPDVSPTFFPNTEPDLMTFCRDRSTISQQFPHFLPSPMIKSSDPPRLQRRLSTISIPTS